MKIKINKIYLSFYSKIKTKKYKRIKKHPYYKSIIDNIKRKCEKYAERCSNNQTLNPKKIWKNITQIHRKISENGIEFFNKEKIIIVRKNGKNVCIHGKHLICILYLIYGKTASLEIINDRVVGISDFDYS